MLIARVADRCFWLGRYLERAEYTARSLSVTRDLALGAEAADRQSWMPVIIVAGEHARFEEKFGLAAAEDDDLVQSYMVWNADNASSIASSVRSVRDNARSIRDALSHEAWEAINELHWWMKKEGPAKFESDRHEFYRHVLKSCVTITGLLRSTMLRDQPLDFMRLGTMLERGSQTARVLDVHHHAIATAGAHVVVDTALWLSLLRACAGFEPFMRRHRGQVSGDAVVAFLLGELRFPRSVAYAIDSAVRRVNSIRPPAGGEDGPTQERLKALHAWLEQRVCGEVADVEVHAILTHVVDEIHAICDEVGQELLGYPAPEAQSQTQAFT